MPLEVEYSPIVSIPCVVAKHLLLGGDLLGNAFMGFIRRALLSSRHPLRRVRLAGLGCRGKDCLQEIGFDIVELHRPLLLTAVVDVAVQFLGTERTLKRADSLDSDVSAMGELIDFV